MSDQAIIAALRDARLSGEKITAYPGTVPADMAHAFALQSAVRSSLGWRHAGWKIGCTSERAQKALKTTGPFPGPLYAERIFPSRSAVPTLESNTRTTEPEIAFTMARDLAPKPGGWSVAETLAAVSTIHPSIEIVNPRLPRGFDDAVEWYVADGGVSHALVLGAGTALPPEAELARISCRVSVNGEERYHGISSNALGGPHLALTWLANDLIAKGLYLKAGDVVTTGVITEVFSTKIGDRVVARYDGLGEVAVKLAPAHSLS